jgi:anti-sigma factor RsiW
LNCHEATKLLHGYVDGELDMQRNLEIDEHLQECARCAQALADLQALRAKIKSGAPSWQPPPDLSNRIQASLRQAGQSKPRSVVVSPRWLAIAASLVLVALAGWGLIHFFPFRADSDVLTGELVASHVRSLMPMPGHLVDVQSDDQHTVKPWFEGKLDFACPVPDLKEKGFVLVGGRLDYLNDRPVAALVYRRRDHILNVFIWRSADGPEQAVQAVTRSNYHLRHWKQGGLTYWVISNLNERELGDFVRLFQAGGSQPSPISPGKDGS